MLPPQEKQLIHAFVQSQVRYKEDFDDVIAGKGRGVSTSLPPFRRLMVPLCFNCDGLLRVQLFLTIRQMIMLLAGPPGVGKTLTAESVAETLKVPLYMMSAGDLGLDQNGIGKSNICLRTWYLLRHH